jgi:hypothetical protein
MDENPGPADLMADLFVDSAEHFYGAEDCKSISSARGDALGTWSTYNACLVGSCQAES